jgi:hypothetical protein
LGTREQGHCEKKEKEKKKKKMKKRKLDPG